MQAYHAGQRVFAENRVQALLERKEALPADISWHLIGHLQSNKVKYIADFIDCIQSVDSLALLEIINQQAAKHGRVINCLLQVFIAQEETKFGLDQSECETVLAAAQKLSHVRVLGLMGMASNTSNLEQVKNEFMKLKELFDQLKNNYHLSELSMGMSSDYLLAIACGSTIVRVGSKVFE